jgi:hypothetical protein
VAYDGKRLVLREANLCVRKLGDREKGGEGSGASRVKPTTFHSQKTQVNCQTTRLLQSLTSTTFSAMILLFFRQCYTRISSSHPFPALFECLLTFTPLAPIPETSLDCHFIHHHYHPIPPSSWLSSSSSFWVDCSLKLLHRES